MKKTILLIITVLLLAVSSPAYSSDAAISGVTIARESDFKINFLVENAFNKDIEEAIKSGVPTSFTFIVKLFRVNDGWFDDEIGRWEFRHTVKYDTFKEEYEVTLDEKGGPSIRTKDISEMKRVMAAGDAVTLNPVMRLARGQSYQIKIMAELRTVKLPFLLDYMFFFVKLWDFETGWYTGTFTI